jgi:hypothetical protein
MRPAQVIRESVWSEIWGMSDPLPSGGGRGHGRDSVGESGAERTTFRGHHAWQSPGEWAAPHGEPIASKSARMMYPDHHARVLAPLIKERLIILDQKHIRKGIIKMSALPQLRPFFPGMIHAHGARADRSTKDYPRKRRPGNPTGKEEAQQIRSAASPWIGRVSEDAPPFG